jgi:hypothetical protein
MNKRATKRKSAAENSMLKILTVSSVSSDSIVKEIIVNEQKTKYLQHFINKHDTIVSNQTEIYLRLLNNTCVKHNFKSVHVSNLF